MVQDLGSQVKDFGLYTQSTGIPLKGFKKDMIRFVYFKNPSTAMWNMDCNGERKILEAPTAFPGICH